MSAATSAGLPSLRDAYAKIDEVLPKLHGWCTPEKGKRLARLAAETRAGLCVELGVFGGRSLLSIAMGLACAGPGRVDGIDPYAPSAMLEGINLPENDRWWSSFDYELVFRHAAQAVADSGLGDRAQIIRARSLEAADRYEDGSIDILHQDSNHSEEISVAEVRVWTRKVRPGGYWIVNDAHWTTVRRAQELLEASGFDLVELHDAWSIFRKVGAEVVLASPGSGPVHAYFDSVFCVNLDRRPDKWMEARRELQACGIGCARVPAVDSPENGENGCAASHRGLWRRIAEGGAGDRVLIFEDDVKFLTRGDLLAAGYSPDSDTVRVFDSCPGETLGERLAAMLPSVPSSWDLLYLGGIYTSLDNVRVGRHAIRAGGMLELHAYGISREYARRVTALLDSVAPRYRCGPLAIDVVLDCQMRCGGAAGYVLSPRLFVQRPRTRSDITGLVTSFFCSRVDAAHELGARAELG